MFQTSAAVYLRTAGVWDFALPMLVFGCERLGITYRCHPQRCSDPCLFELWRLAGHAVRNFGTPDQHEQRNNSEHGRPQILFIYEANATLPSVLAKTYASLQACRAVWLRTVVSFDVNMHCCVCGLKTSFERTLWTSLSSAAHTTGIVDEMYLERANIFSM